MKNIICLGEDLNGELYLKEVPQILNEYVDEIQRTINKIFYSGYLLAVPRDFIKDMQNRGILHKFIDKYITVFFDTITTNNELENLLFQECKYIFDIKEDDTNFNIIYKQYDKTNSINSYLSRKFEDALVDYKKRLDEVHF